MTIVEFLLARIAEDEAVARAYPARRWKAVGGGIALDGPPSSFRIIDDDAVHENVTRQIARWDPARVLAECEAKRRIVELSAEASDDREYVIAYASTSAAMNARLRATDPGELILKALALPYVDHPDYDPEWAL